MNDATQSTITKPKREHSPHRPKTAIIQICYEGQDYCLRCPGCESLNINDTEGDNFTCPDCGQQIIRPEIQFCNCTSPQLHQQTQPAGKGAHE